jgi:hypothetical protein
MNAAVRCIELRVDCGIVDEGIDPAEPIANLLDHPPDGHRIRYIHHDSHAFGTVQLAHDSLCRGLIDVSHDDVRPGAGQRLRMIAAEQSCSSRENDDSTLQWALRH